MTDAQYALPTTFTFSVDPSDSVESHHTEYRHGMEWGVCLYKDDDGDELHDVGLQCCPITELLDEDWFCRAECSVYKVCFKEPALKSLARKNLFFNPADWWSNFVFDLDDDCTLIFKLTITELHLGRPSLPLPAGKPVSFQRLINPDNLELGVEYRSTHVAYPRSWEITVENVEEPVRKSADQLKIGLSSLRTLPIIGNEKLPLHAIITLTEQTGDKGNTLTCKSAIRKIKGACHTNAYECGAKLSTTGLSGTLLISVTINRSLEKCSALASSEEKPPSLDFGRENMSIPQHGNFTLILADGTNLKLNSLPLSHNSPELRKLIVDANIIEHDVTDFDSAAVRIFVDACYSGTLEKLTEAAEFSVFQALVKMFAVFKVVWALEGCVEFFKTAFRQSSSTFLGLMDSSRFAVKMSTKFKFHDYLDHVVASVDREMWRKSLPRALRKASTKADLDFIMVLSVENNLISEFISFVGMLPDSSGRSKDLLTVLENFNFALCDQEVIGELCENLLDICQEGEEGEAVRNFAKMFQMESGDVAGASGGGEVVAGASGDVAGASGGEVIAGASGAGASGAGTGASEAGAGASGAAEVLEDGTLSTLARMEWARVMGSTWPCTRRRPFSDKPRQLIERGGPPSADE